jgi:hypothetical protein
MFFEFVYIQIFSTGTKPITKNKKEKGMWSHLNKKTKNAYYNNAGRE